MEKYFQPKRACEFSSSLQQVCDIIQFTELFLLLCNFFGFPIFIHFCCKITLHVNLKYIIGFLAYNFFLNVIIRIIVIVTEQKLFFAIEISEEVINTIYSFCFHVHLYFIEVYVCSQLAICVERVAATCFIKDYEIARRTFIYKTSIFLTFLGSALGSLIYISSFGTYVVAITAILAAINACSGFFAMYALEKRNKQMLKSISTGKQSVDVDYTLSIRFQIHENIHSTQLIRNVFILYALANLLFVPVFILAKNSGFFGNICINRLLELSFNTLIVLSSTAVPAISLSSHRQYRDLTKDTWLLGLFSKYMDHKDDTIGKTEEGNLYFQRLSQQWQ